MSDVIFGSSVLAAGWACDRLEDLGFATLDVYAGIFLLGWLGRTLVAALLVPLDEPGAWRAREVIALFMRRLSGRERSTGIAD